MEYTAEQLEEAIEAAFDTGGVRHPRSPYPIELWDELAYTTEGTIDVGGVNEPFKRVAEDLGGEGHGENIMFVIEVAGALYRKDGFYAGHDGAYWDGPFRVVKPVVRSVTFFE